MTIETILVGVVAVGIVGSAIEKVGVAIHYPRVEAFGQMIESITADVPKFIENVSAVITNNKDLVSKILDIFGAKKKQ